MDNIKGLRTTEGKELSKIKIVKDSKVIDGFIEIVYKDGRKELLNKNYINTIVCEAPKPETDPEEIPEQKDSKA